MVIGEKDPNAIEQEKKAPKLGRRIRKNKMFQKRNIQRQKKKMRKARNAAIIIRTRKPETIKDE